MRHIAQKIPRKFRSFIVQQNLIANAVMLSGNYAMMYLMVVWRDYLEPELVMDCNLCFKRILDNFKALQPELIQMEKEDSLLDGNS